MERISAVSSIAKKKVVEGSNRLTQHLLTIVHNLPLHIITLVKTISVELLLVSVDKIMSKALFFCVVTVLYVISGRMCCTTNMSVGTESGLEEQVMSCYVDGVVAGR